MPLPQMISEFSGLTVAEKARFLCRLGTRLTVLFRVLHADKDSIAQARDKMPAINEMCHKVFGQLGHIMEKDGLGYPDGVFVAALSATAAENGLTEEFSRAWDAVASQVRLTEKID